MPGITSRAIVVVAACVLGGCVAAAHPRVNTSIDATPSDRSIGAGDLARAGDVPADEAIAHLRPELLRDQYRGTPVEIRIDDRPASMAALHVLPASEIADARMLTATEAALEYGPWHSYPVLQVTLVHSVSR